MRGQEFDYRSGDRLSCLKHCCRFLRCRKADVTIVPQIKPRPFPSASFSVHDSLIIVLFDAVSLTPGVLKTSRHQWRVMLQSAHCMTSITSLMQFFRYLLYPSQLYMFQMLRPSIFRSTAVYRREGTIYVRMWCVVRGRGTRPRRLRWQQILHFLTIAPEERQVQQSFSNP